MYPSRRDCHSYKHSHEQILARYGSRLKMCDELPLALRLDMGDRMYTANVRTSVERDAFIRYVQQRA